MKKDKSSSTETGWKDGGNEWKTERFDLIECSFAREPHFTQISPPNRRISWSSIKLAPLFSFPAMDWIVSTKSIGGSPVPQPAGF